MRVVLAGAAGALLTAAATEALQTNPAVTRLEVVTSRLTAAALRAYSPDLLVVAAYSHLLGQRTLTVPVIGVVGLHPALLPRYRGSYPLWWALRNRERFAGLTLYRLNEELDAGPIIAQARVPVASRDTFATLYRRVAAEVAPLLDPLIAHCEAHRVLPSGTPQDEEAATFYPRPAWAQRLAARVRWAIRSRTGLRL